MKNKTFIAITTVSFLLVIIILLSTSNYGINIYDEGIPLVGAGRVAHGEVPYRDFWTMYGPGQFYFMAAMLDAFGWTLAAERVVSVVVAALAIFFLFLVSGDFNRRSKPFVTVLIASAWLACCPIYGRSLLTAVLLLIVQIYMLKNHFRTGSYFWLGAAAAIGALTVTFRQDFIIYTLLPPLFFIIYQKFIIGRTAPGKTNPAVKALLSGGFYILIFLIILAPVAIYFLNAVPFETLWQQLVQTPLEIFPKYRRLAVPIPFIAGSWTGAGGNYLARVWNSAVYWAPAAIFVFSIYQIMKDRQASPEIIRDPSYFTRWMVIVTGLALYLQASVRADGEHIMPSLLLSAVMLPHLSGLFARKGPRVIFVSLAVAFLIIVPAAKWTARLGESFSIDKNEFFSIKRAQRISGKKEFVANYQKAIEYIQDNTAPNEKIFCGTTHHDRIFINDVMFYFLADRPPATRYEELHPGVATSSGVQTEIIAELEASSVRYIVLTDAEDIAEPNASRFSSGVNLLDEYIETHFELEKKFGNYIILVRSKSIDEPLPRLTA